MMLTNEEVAQTIIQQFGEAVSDFDDPYDLLTFSTSRETIVSIIQYLKEHPTYQIGFLTDITAVHYPDSLGKEFCDIFHRIAQIEFHDFQAHLPGFDFGEIENIINDAEQGFR